MTIINLPPHERRQRVRASLREARREELPLLARRAVSRRHRP